METLGYTPEHKDTEPQLAHKFLELSEEQVADLKARIAKFNGTLRVFVHPFYWLIRKGEASQKQIDNSIEVMGFLGKLLREEEDRTPPILIMEEGYLADEAGVALQKFAQNSQNQFYYIQTFDNEGTPKFPNDDEGITEDNLAENWSDFSAILKLLGVEKIIIAGGDFDVLLLTEGQKAELLEAIQPFLNQRATKGAKKLNYAPKGCAGGVATILAHNFDVEISNFAKPISRKGLGTIEQSEPRS